MPTKMKDIFGFTSFIPPDIQENIRKEMDASNPLATRAKVLIENGYKTLTRNNTFHICSEDDGNDLPEVIISNYSSRTILPYDGFFISVFMSNNAASLAKIYIGIGEPKHDELMVFIEVQDKYNTMGTFLKVKVGSDISAKKDLPFRDILLLAKNKKYLINEKSVLNILNREVYKQTKSGFFIFNLIHAILVAKEELEKIVFTEVGEFFGIKVTGWIDELRIDESRWNPDHADYPKKAMLPRSVIDEMTKGSANSQQKQEKIRDFVVAQIETGLGDVLNKGDGILMELSQNGIFGKSLFQKIHKQWKALSLAVASQKKKII
jgi:hypothetical protein